MKNRPVMPANERGFCDVFESRCPPPPPKLFADEIAAAHPMVTGRHDLYAQAMELVGERHEKGELVALVNWLLAQIDELTTVPVIVLDSR